MKLNETGGISRQAQADAENIFQQIETKVTRILNNPMAQQTSWFETSIEGVWSLSFFFCIDIAKTQKHPQGYPLGIVAHAYMAKTEELYHIAYRKLSLRNFFQWYYDKSNPYVNISFVFYEKNFDAREFDDLADTLAHELMHNFDYSINPNYGTKQSSTKRTRIRSSHDAISGNTTQKGFLRECGKALYLCEDTEIKAFTNGSYAYVKKMCKRDTELSTPQDIDIAFTFTCGCQWLEWFKEFITKLNSSPRKYKLLYGVYNCEQEYGMTYKDFCVYVNKGYQKFSRAMYRCLALLRNELTTDYDHEFMMTSHYKEKHGLPTTNY